METLVSWLLEALGPAVIYWLLLGFGVKELTEVLKGITRGIGDWTKVEWMKVGGYGSLAVATIVALGATYGFDVNLPGYFDAFQGEDPELMQILTALITLGIARYYKRQEAAAP